jgi:MFS family permease
MATLEETDHKDVDKYVEDVLIPDPQESQPLATVLWESRKILFYCLCCCIGSMLWGFDVGVNTITMALPAFKMVFGYEYEGELLIDAKWNSLWTAMTSIGMILGGVVCGTLSDRWGRKAGMLMGSILSIVGVAVQYISNSAGVLLVGKIVRSFLSLLRGVYANCPSSTALQWASSSQQDPSTSPKSPPSRSALPSLQQPASSSPPVR